MPEAWIDSLTLSGDPDDVAGQIDRLVTAGATSVLVSPVNAATFADELALVAEAVLPRFSRD
jgi:alkanesulfonate monooxygenase SsuD/methylene tetrahydromethanopterin reductase-like flavin-dependent oxidoreductase (luciferase family)